MHKHVVKLILRTIIRSGKHYGNKIKVAAKQCGHIFKINIEKRAHAQIKLTSQ